MLWKNRPMRILACSLVLAASIIACSPAPAPKPRSDRGNSSAMLQWQDLVSIDDCPERRSADDPPLSYHRPPPRFPAEAIANRISGRVLVEADFTRDGRLLNPRAIAWEPSPIFNRAAIEAVAQWRYCPVADGDPGYETPFKIVIPFVHR